MAAPAMNALSVRDVAISFGGVHAVTGVSLELAPGERHVLLGPNGAGKTTLFNMIGGQLRPDRGSIALYGDDITRLRPFQRAHAGLARTFQITSLFPTLSVEDNMYLAIQAIAPVRYAMARDAASVTDTVGRLESLLADWRFAAERHTIVRDLSYGEQRKLELAMALCRQPRLLLLDEPTAGLSTSETENIITLLQGLSRDVAVLVIEHDMDVAFEIGERFTIMNQGAVVIEGKAEEIRANAEIQAIYFGEAE
jgi:branched-chain amino acid transport system ATP-binding protein